uniref:Uncharacterized protein n=3 Tax=environmental samples TaxID=651140 RepID=A0A075H099_9ARCH|nr:hypothetical protein [uncultured marine thaumarchaeote KM3_40_A11]AIF12211.1 hypothetical protein [uncultured marine thaumarchaeote KM3_54_H01]AIF12293.1 hypothetical protein [uncultured marine thaumarchaeote KM3_55_A12]
MTFITDLDDLIRHRHGDVKKLREIRDTVRHDNFITTEDKNYVESLITIHLKNQPLDKSLSRKQPDTKIKLRSKPTASSSDSPSNFTFNFSSSKNIGILGGGGAAAVIAIIVLVGFPAINTPLDSITSSTTSNPLLVNIDQTTYQRADIISISGDTNSYTKSVELSIENTNGVKIWKETINPKNDGQFSTLIIAGGGGWENNGVYTLKAVQDDLASEIEFKIIA